MGYSLNLSANVLLGGEIYVRKPFRVDGAFEKIRVIRVILMVEGILVIVCGRGRGEEEADRHHHMQGTNMETENGVKFGMMTNPDYCRCGCRLSV